MKKFTSVMVAPFALVLLINSKLFYLKFFNKRFTACKRDDGKTERERTTQMSIS